MQRHPAHRSHLLTAMLFSLVAVGAMCVFVAATSGLHIQTGFLNIQLGPETGNQVVIGNYSTEEAQTSTLGEDPLDNESAIPLDAVSSSSGLLDKTTDLVDQVTCPTGSVCLSTLVKDSGFGETLEDLTDDLAGSSLGGTVDDAVGDALDAETLGDTVDEVVEGAEETVDDLLDEVEGILEDLGDEVEDIVDDLLGGLGLGD